MTKYSFLVLFLLTLVGCKKEEVTPDSLANELPVFMIMGNIDGEPVNFQAGVNGAYLSTHSVITAGVERFSGRIVQGENYSEFGLYNGNLLLPNSNITQVGTKISLSSPPNVALFNLNKELLNNYSNIESIDIKVNGKPYGKAVTIYEPGIYEICVDVHFLDAQQSSATICNTIVLGYKDFGAFKIQHSTSGSGQVQALIITAGQIANVDWFVDNVYVSSGNNFSGAISESGHVLMAEVSFANGVLIKRQVFVNGFDESVFVEDMMNFKLSLAETLMRDFKADFSIFRNGILYTHVPSVAQPEVIITGFSYYGLNTSGKEVYKLTGTISTQMKNNTTSSIVNAQFNVAIGIEIP